MVQDLWCLQNLLALAATREGEERESMNIEQASGMTMPFGKHRGKTLAEIAADDVSYIAWLDQKADIRRDDLRAAVHTVALANRDAIEEAARRPYEPREPATETTTSYDRDPDNY
jgi:uncharacterized protein (DUF3820 family)